MNCCFISGEVSIAIDKAPFFINAEHLVLLLSLLFYHIYPQLLVIQGEPIELPDPKIINFIFSTEGNKLKKL